MVKYLRPGIFALLLICNFFATVKAQEYVLNPSFENTSGCPQGISEFALASNWYTTTTPSSDTCSTPDLYAGCTPSIGGSNSPNGLLGYQPSRTGTHHAGIILGDGFVGCIPLNDNYREYIEGTISPALTAGQKYLVKFYLNLPDDVMWGSNSIGVHFTSSVYTHDACASQLINVTPELEMCGPAIIDTVNWVAVQWIYTATGGEHYFTIGNFKNDANTNRVPHHCQSFNPYIYYYIDDVSITPYTGGYGTGTGNNDCAVTLQTDSVNATCGSNNGSVAVTPSGCTSPFIYHWGSGATTSTLTNIGAGTYTVTVTDNTACQETIAVTVNTNTLNVDITPTNPSCGSSNGSITALASNGTGPYNYAWSNSANTATISNLSSGTYHLTVTGAPGCLAVDSVTLFGSSGVTVTPAVTDATCGGTDGAITANVSGGTPPYTFNWSNSQTTQTISNLSAGQYTVTVNSDTTGSVFFTENFDNGATGWQLNLVGPGTNGGSNNQWIINNDASCGSCGTNKHLHITCNPSLFFCLPTTGQCTYFPGPSAFGNTATDLFTSSPDISTINRANITLKFKYTCYGETGVDYGLVRLSKDGGVTWTDLPTQYQDSSSCAQASIAIPAIYQNISNFRIGFRWINDVNGTGNDPGFEIDDVQLSAGGANCPTTSTVTVGTIGGLTVGTTSVSPSCGLNNGSITANVTAGTGPYTYQWNNSATGQTITGLGSGLYTVTVSNQSGCSATASTSLFGSNVPTLSPSSTDAGCTVNNGTATVNVSPAGTYTYLWNNSATTQTISGLPAGTYTVTVTAVGGCTATASVAVNVPSAVSLTPSSTAATCGNSNGTASVTATTGTAPYTYLWSNFATTQTINNLSGSTYSVVVTDAGGCTASATVSVTSTSAVNASASAVSTTCGGSNGSATATVTAGTGPYTYAWSNSGNTQTINNLPATTYTVTVTGAGGCTATASTTVSPSTGLTLNSTGSSTTCGGNNGTASVNVTAGTGPYSYSWDNSGTTQTITGLASGTYNVTVTGNGGCTATSSATVNGSTGVSVSATATPTNCGNSDGSATVNINTGSAPFSYAWDNSGSTQTISNLTGGNYTVTVTGSGSCTATASVSVASSVAAGVTASSTASGCTSTGTASANVTSGNAPYTYAWSNNGTTQTITNLSANTYTITLTSAGGCTATASTTVATTGGGVALSTTSTDANCGASNGSATVTVTAGNAPFTYAWNPSVSTGNSINNVAGGTYTVTVTGTGGCTAYAVINIASTAPVTISATPTATRCGAANGSATVTVTAGTAPYTYAWTGGASTQTISNLTSGTYSVTVTGAGGCTATTSVSVASSTNVSAIATSTNTNCGGSTGSVTVNASSGSAPYTYLWDNSGSSTTATVNSLPAGTYNVTVTDNAGCSATATTSIVSNGADTTSVFSDKLIICTSDSAHICGRPGFVTYHWNTGENTQCIYKNAAGNYYLTATDGNGCTYLSNHFALATYPIPSVQITVNSDTLTVYGNVSYQWYYNNSPIPNATSPIYIATQEGAYSVLVTDSNGCKALSTNTSVKVGISSINWDERIKVYPNPLGTGHWNVDVTTDWLGGWCELYDADGKLVYRIELASLKSEIALNAAQGVYIMKLYNDKYNVALKLVKL